MSRKVFMPGVPLDAGDILGDLSPNTIYAIPHQDEFVVVFIGSDRRLSARAMNRQQLEGFSKEVLRVHQAIRDDEKIAKFEKEFGTGGTDECE